MLAARLSGVSNVRAGLALTAGSQCANARTRRHLRVCCIQQSLCDGLVFEKNHVCSKGPSRVSTGMARFALLGVGVPILEVHPKNLYELLVLLPLAQLACKAFLNSSRSSP